jgi:putative endonuclease
MLEHKAGVGSKFSAKYGLTDLLFFENFQTMVDAIEREKQLKNWHRDWKWNLIRAENPKLIDLANDWFTDTEIAEYWKENKDR